MIDFKIDSEFSSVLPPLSDEERAGLEAAILADGCRDPLVVWRGLLIDGHNRYEICQRNGMPFATVEMEFEDRARVRIWMRDNQSSRRNINDAWRIDLARENKADLAEVGAAKKVEAGKTARDKQLGVLSPNDKTPEQPKHDTRAEIAKAAGASTGMVGMAEVVIKSDPELWEKAKAGETTITGAYKKIKKRDELSKRHEAIKAQSVAESDATPCTISHRDALEWLHEQAPFDLLLTDPPYSTDVDDIDSFARSWLPLALSKLKATGRAFVFVGAYPKELAAYLNVAMPTQVLVWTYRNTLGPSPKLDYKANWQAILYYRMPDAEPLDCQVMLEQFSVQDINAPDGRMGDRYHAWQKPMEIGERFVRHATKPGDIVADPFACTGTFLLAAAKLGRVGVGCDISEENIKIAVDRGCRNV